MTTKTLVVALAWAFAGLTVTARAEASQTGVCMYADNAVAKVTATVTGAGVGGGLALKALGVMALEHSSGGTILYAAGAYLPHTLGIVGTAGAALTAVPTLVVGGIATTAIGGTLLYCHYAKK